MLKKIVRDILGKEYQTLNLIEVSKKALFNNFHFFQKQHPEALVCPVLKSNAYGHGLKLVGKFVDEEIKPPFIIVDSLYEAYELSKVKIETPILIIGYTLPANFKTWRKLNFTFPAYDEETIAALAKYQPEARIHLKVDTGMSRLGIMPGQVPDFIKLIKKYPRLQIEGIYSHLSQADNNRQKKFTEEQLKKFRWFINQFEQAGLRFKWKHLAATSGSYQIKDPEINLIRLGLGFYGISPFAKNSKINHKLKKNLQPALKLTSHLAQVKEIPPKSKISYGGTFTTKKKTTVGIIPFGYYDGLDRRLSNKGKIKIKNKFSKILGRVCMNITIVDLNNVRHAKVGETVTIFDNNPESPNNIRNSAKLCQTIPYTLLVNLSETIRRRLVE